MKILVVEDDPITNRMLEKYLVDLDFEVSTASNGRQGWEIFCQEDIRFVITDWMMPEMNGIELIKKIREANEKQYCYIILLTAKNEKDEIVEGISSGADDYIIKPFHKEELAVRVRAGQRIVDLQSELFDANEELKRLSETDPLTGLYNRRALSDYLIKSQSAPGYKRTPFAFIMADIDRFKKINDIYGHDSGDAVLVKIVRKIKDSVQNNDMISRIGGEEFYVVLPDADLKQAEDIAENMRRSIETSPIVLPYKKEFYVTCSFGVFCVQANREWDWEHCMKMADKALYESKNSGRNKVTVLVDESERTHFPGKTGLSDAPTENGVPVV